MSFTPPGLAFLFLAGSFVATAQEFVISTYAGAPRPTTVNNSMHATNIVADKSGNVYFISNDISCICIFKLDSSGAITRVAGSAFGFSGGPLEYLNGLALDNAGNFYVAEWNQQRVQKVSPGGIVTTIAGGGSLAGASADGGPATNAQLHYPSNVAADSAGNVYISETAAVDEADGNERIRKVSPEGIITTVAGTGVWGFSGDSGPATIARLAVPGSLVVDTNGNIFFVDEGNRRIRKISPDGIITTVVDASAVNTPSAAYPFNNLALDAAGNLFFTVHDASEVFKLTPEGDLTPMLPRDAGLAVWWVAVDSAGSLFVSDGTLRRVAGDGSIVTITGDGACCYAGDGGPAREAQLNHVSSVAADRAGNLFIADTENHRIRKVSRDGIMTTVAGNGSWSAGCDASAASRASAIEAELCKPSAVAVDDAGDLFIVDRNRIRKVSPDGSISLLAGDGTIGDSGEGGPAAVAQLAYPNSLAVDSVGNVYVAEWARVRKIAPEGIITTVAGNGTRPTNGPPAISDGMLAGSVQLTAPTSVASDRGGSVYFIDTIRVRKVSPDGTITTVAGNGAPTGYRGYNGDGGSATSAPLWAPNGIAFDSVGNLFISEPARIRKVGQDGTISTVAGNGEPGYSGDGGSATKAQLWNPVGVTVDGRGNVYVADSLNNVIRILQAR